MTQTVVARFDSETVARLENLEKMTGRAKSYYIKEAVNENLDELELVYLAKSRAEDLRAGRNSTIPWDEVKRQNDLQD